MGMLDDAIREHLELKRLKGSDPGEVARQEREALGPVRRLADSAPNQDRQAAMADSEEPADDEEEAADGERAGSEERADGEEPMAFEAVAAASRPVEQRAGQETLEINMEAELIDEPRSGKSPAANRAGSAESGGRPADPQASSGESLEWEMPGDRAAVDEENPENGEPSAGEDQVEDVLEETPDFLRETPEHERLWFEQRPPRDFDFNE